jgi:hypothetical protein
MIHKEITIECNTKQQEQKTKQLEINYLLCNTSNLNNT